MSEKIRLWEIQKDELIELPGENLDLEKKLEDWLENDITILSNDILIIGRQVPTQKRGEIDLLGINRAGDLVVIELKRDKTPRDVTAQAIDYVSCVKDWTPEEIFDLANEYLKSWDEGSFEDCFKERFKVNSLPETLNEHQQALIVAAEIDDSTERIVNYLVREYGVRINIATFQLFRKDKGPLLMACKFFISPKEAEQSTSARQKSKRTTVNATYEELEQWAKENEVYDQYIEIKEWADKVFDAHSTGKQHLSYKLNMGKAKNTVFTIWPASQQGDYMLSSKSTGLYCELRTERVAEQYGVSEKSVIGSLPSNAEESEYNGTLYIFHLKTQKDVTDFIAEIDKIMKN